MKNNLLNDVFPLEVVRSIAWNRAKEILEELGVDENDEHFAIKQYELQFNIYNAIKQTLGIKTDVD